jgi:hypothetical protein
MAAAVTLMVSPAAAAQRVATPPPARGTFASVIVPGAVLTQAEDVTDSGLIVGCFQRKSGSEHGFVDRHGAFVTIKDPVAGSAGMTCVLAVNSAGVIVGEYQDKSSVLHGFEDTNGKFTTIDPPGAGHRSGQGSVAVDISNTGVIAGWYITRKQVKRGFVLKDGKFTTVSDPAAGNSKFEGTGLVGIADNGTIAGSYTDASGHQHGFWLRNGRFHRVDVPGAVNTDVVCISDRNGLLVGEYQTSARASFAGFTDHHGVFRSLRDPAARFGTLPQCGNDLGKVVGFYDGAKHSVHAFEFTPGKVSPAIQAGGQQAPGMTPAFPAPRSRLP